VNVSDRRFICVEAELLDKAGHLAVRDIEYIKFSSFETDKDGVAVSGDPHSGRLSHLRNVSDLLHAACLPNSHSLILRDGNELTGVTKRLEANNGGCVEASECFERNFDGLFLVVLLFLVFFFFIVVDDLSFKVEA